MSTVAHRTSGFRKGAAATVMLSGLLASLVVTSHSVSAASRSRAGTPTAVQVRALMARTVERKNQAVHFVPQGPGGASTGQTIKDGKGTGTLTAAIGTRVPANVSGSLVFFWHNAAFAGWDAPYESVSVLAIQSSGPGSFTITYTNYRKTDKSCCPSLPPMHIVFRWNGKRLVAGGAVPSRPGGKVHVTLIQKRLPG